MIHKLKMEDVIKDNKENEGYFFDKDTMEYWGSEIETELINGEYFVTSEDNFDGTKKLYSIRRYDWDKHSVETISFQKFKTRDAAVDALLELLGGTNA